MRDNRMTSRAGLLGIAAASALALTACGTDEISTDVLNEALDEAENHYTDEVSCDEPLAMEDGASVECGFVDHRGNDSDVALTYSEEAHAIEWTSVAAGGGDITVELDDDNEPIFEDDDEDAASEDVDEEPAQEPAEEEPAIEPTEDPAEAEETEEPAVDPLDL